ASGPVSAGVVLAGTYLDTANPIPSDFASSPGSSNTTWNEMLNEVLNAQAANGWAIDVNAYFQIYTPAGIGTSTQYCGFHTDVIYSTGSPAFTMGLVLFPRPGCVPGGPFPHDEFSDSAISVSAHEIMETVTDPYFAGWYFVDGSGEIGDLCNFDFGT